MQLEQIQGLMERIGGCTFASLDTDTMPKPGVRRVATGEVVILFTNKNSSGYQNMVRRRLADAGKDPESFDVSDLPWGQRVEGTPIIEHYGRHYLQTILLKEGTCRYYIGQGPAEIEISADEFKRFVPDRMPGENQGLGERGVVVRTYRLDNILEIRLMHEKITAEREAA